MRNLRNVLSWILIAAGLLLCGIAVRHYWRGEQAQSAGRRSFDETRLAASRRPADENPGIVVTASNVREATAPEIGKPIARLRIPSARIDSIVFEGSDSETLEKGPGHIPGTEVPGGVAGRKNCVITGHRDSHFRRLGWLRRGHRIELETPNGKKVYQVVAREIVEPTAVRVLDATPSPRLTLITCYPFNYIGPAPKRLVVVAEPAS